MGSVPQSVLLNDHMLFSSEVWYVNLSWKVQLFTHDHPPTAIGMGSQGPCRQIAQIDC